MVLRARLSRIAVFGVFVMTIIAGLAAAQQSQQAAPAAAAAKAEFEGTVKVGLGKYLYLPSAKGYDILVQGKISGQDASSLDGKEVIVKGEMLKDEPSVFVADSIEVKEGGNFRNVFTRSEEVKLEDHLSAAARVAFQTLKITGVDKTADWEGKTTGKVYGRMGTAKSADGKETVSISVPDDKGKEVGKVIVDSTTDFAKYYIKKLKLFDNFWFYLKVKDTVDVKVRRRTRELFHADLVFAGLY
jgi:hypothetical protein